MNLLNAIPTYHYKPNTKEFNEFINKIDSYTLKEKDAAVILMNEETIKFLILESETFNNYANVVRSYFSFRGIKVAIANWLETGEVKIVHEV